MNDHCDLPENSSPIVGNERGMATAEYAVGTVTACGFGGLLYKLLTSDFGESFIQGLFDNITGLLPF